MGTDDTPMHSRTDVLITAYLPVLMAIEKHSTASRISAFIWPVMRFGTSAQMAGRPFCLLRNLIRHDMEWIIAFEVRKKDFGRLKGGLPLAYSL